MTRRPYAWFVAALVVIPAVVVTILEVVFDVRGAASGLRFLELGILAAFAAQYPKAVFWPGIPAWVIAAVIIGIDYLQILGDRDDYGFAMLTSTVVVALVGLRSFGHAESLPQIPRVPLPAFVTGTITTSPAARRRSKPSRGRRPLRSVPGPDDDRRAEMEIDALLDQVASHGLESLTKAQRKRLEQHSRDLRRRRDQG